MKKTKIKLDDIERRILVKLVYEKRNELIGEGRHHHWQQVNLSYAM